jgi:hypothetical protein
MQISVSLVRSTEARAQCCQILRESHKLLWVNLQMRQELGEISLRFQVLASEAVEMIVEALDMRLSS